MTAFEIIVAAYLALIPPLLGALFLRRFDHLERRLDGISGAVALCATREELGELRREVGDLRREGLGDLRRETAALRSDLTQVALAVGARPRASGG